MDFPLHLISLCSFCAYEKRLENCLSWLSRIKRVNQIKSSVLTSLRNAHGWTLDTFFQQYSLTMNSICRSSISTLVSQQKIHVFGLIYRLFWLRFTLEVYRKFWSTSRQNYIVMSSQMFPVEWLLCTCDITTSWIQTVIAPSWKLVSSFCVMAVYGKMGWIFGKSVTQGTQSSRCIVSKVQSEQGAWCTVF